MRHRTGSRVTLAALLLALPAILFASSASEIGSRDPRAHFFIQTFGDLREELQLARDENKLGMLLFFEAESCSYCQHMLRRVLNQPQVQDWYNGRFLSVAVDIHGDVELTDFDGITLPSKVFAEHRRVFMTPVISFIDLKGAEIYRHLGMIKTPAEFLLLGEYIEQKHYFDTEFHVFARARGMGRDEPLRGTPAEVSE